MSYLFLQKMGTTQPLVPTCINICVLVHMPQVIKIMLYKHNTNSCSWLLHDFAAKPNIARQQLTLSAIAGKLARYVA